MGNIVIADSHALCRRAICDFIRHAESGLEVREAGDFAELQKMIKGAPADLLILERDLPGFDPAEDAAFLTGTKIAYFIPHHLRDLPDGAHSAGVFPKDMPCKEILSGIHEILGGRSFHPVFQEERHTALTGVARPQMEDYNLTAREREVLSHLMRGASNKEIGRALDLQVVTIKLHVRGICRKLKAANRTQAALVAMENGWV